MTTYNMIYKDLDCPICGKPLIEHEQSDRVACSDSKCRFNTDLNNYHTNQFNEIYNNLADIKNVELDNSESYDIE